jgi:hypothetical protein
MFLTITTTYFHYSFCSVIRCKLQVSKEEVSLRALKNVIQRSGVRGYQSSWWSFVLILRSLYCAFIGHLLFTWECSLFYHLFLRQRGAPKAAQFNVRKEEEKIWRTNRLSPRYYICYDIFVFVCFFHFLLFSVLFLFVFWLTSLLGDLRVCHDCRPSLDRLLLSHRGRAATDVPASRLANQEVLYE